MSIPTFETMLRPILALSATGPITRVVVAEEMSRHFNLSAEERAARIPSGGSTYIVNRSGWSMTFLTKAALIEKVAPKQYRATERGRQFLVEHPESITVSDLRAVEGWSQAWGDGDDAMADAPEVDADDQSPAAWEARVQWTVERILPDPTIRRAVLEFLAFAIENADEERADAWHIKVGRKRVELKTGRLLALRLEPGRVGVSVIRPIAEDVRATLGLRDEDVEEWKLIEGGWYLTLIPEQAAAGLDRLREPFARFVDATIGRVRSRVDLSEHSTEAVTYLSKVVGRDLPQPEIRSSADERDTDDGVQEDAEVSRIPVIRGRAPIFEHGQRAIGSLIEDVDPERGGIALPDLQRPFVWEDTKVRDLLDSLFIGFPVGTLVLWHTADEREARALGSASRVLRATTLIIDGQQRLTSLYAVMRGREIQDKEGNRRRITIAFRPRDGRFEVADAAIANDPEFLPDVTELWSGQKTGAQIRKDVLKRLAEAGRSVDEAYADAVEENLDRAHDIRNYRFPTVEIRKTASTADVDEEDVADIFVRINNQGSRLGQADFVLTLLSVFHGELRDRIESRAREMSRDAVVSVDTQQVLRTSCAVGFGRARMSAIYKYIRGIDPITGDANPARRVERLETLDRAADECLDPTSWRDYMLRVMHAGFVTDHLVASTNAVTNAYAFYVLGRRGGSGKPRIEEGISRWLFGTLATARYSGSSETKFEEDLAQVIEIPAPDVDAFVGALDGMLGDVLTDDYWTRTLPAALETQRGRAPAALAFRAAQVVLGTRALFSDQLLQNLLAPPAGGARKASEMHHLFPKAWLQKRGVTDRRRINQVANLADVGWHENGSVGAESPAKYVPRIREQLKLTDDRWGRMCAEHALPIGWESMEYDEFLASRRPRMAEIVRIAFRKLGGEQDSSPLTPPWFLPGGEVVWQRIAEVERGLRRVVREVYAEKFGIRAVEAISDALEPNEREHLSRATRNRPSTADPMTVVDYLYLSQLPKLLFRSEVWAEARVRLGNDAEAKRRLQAAVESIAPVRNEIAHVREVSPDRLQRASVACGDVLGMLPKP